MSLFFLLIQSRDGPNDRGRDRCYFRVVWSSPILLLAFPAHEYSNPKSHYRPMSLSPYWGVIEPAFPHYRRDSPAGWDVCSSAEKEYVIASKHVVDPVYRWKFSKAVTRALASRILRSRIYGTLLVEMYKSRGIEVNLIGHIVSEVQKLAQILGLLTFVVKPMQGIIWKLVRQ